MSSYYTISSKSNQSPLKNISLTEYSTFSCEWK